MHVQSVCTFLHDMDMLAISIQVAGAYVGQPENQ